jgi:AraC-like DNA-binding protein
MACQAGRVLNESDIYREWAPPPGWKQVVACCWEQRVSAGRVQRVLPDGCADLIVYDSGRTEVVGLHDRAAFPLLSAGAHLRGIRFRPEAVAAAFQIRASSLRNQTLPADTVLGSKVARRLFDASAVDKWIRSISPDPRLSGALNLLATRSVDEAAHALGMTGRHLRRLVVSNTGLSPKVYQQVIRLRRFVDALDAGTPLAAAAAAAGYTDQPHLTRDVHRFCEITPARLAHERRPS